MTVHKAKGLEFPVVVLVDITCKLSRDTADRYLDPDRNLCALRLAGWAPVDLLDHEPLEVDRDKHEGNRLAYVAATRARDLLVVPAVGDGPFTDGWVSPLNAAIYPPFDQRRSASETPGCPAFKRDSVLERPNGDPARADTVHPGGYRLASGDRAYDVVWWDPGVLDLGDRTPMGVRHEGLIGKDAPRTVVEDTIAAYRAWEARRDDALARGVRASLVVQTATDWAGSDEDTPLDIETDGVDVQTVETGDRARPSGARLGALVHAVLGSVALDADRARIEEVVIVHARLLGASAEESATAGDLVERTLAHSLLTRARAAASRGQCRREVPLTYTGANATLVEGIADLAFEEDGQWIVVDVKTDVEIGRLGLERYQRQVALYAAAVARATGKPVSATLLRV
jgi:ATP-dependent exoDNAse (exonuclease V) beta subunit